MTQTTPYIPSQSAYDALLKQPGLIQKVMFSAASLLSLAGKGSMATLAYPIESDWFTQTGILLEIQAALVAHAKSVGQRICQDWSGQKELAPNTLLSSQERDVLYRISEQDNSKMRDYIAGADGFHDEMCFSFAIAEAVRVIALYYRNASDSKGPLPDVKTAVVFAAELLKDTVESESDVFNFAIRQIQVALGVSSGDAAGIFFSDDTFFEQWPSQTQAEREQALLKYVKFELDYLIES